MTSDFVLRYSLPIFIPCSVAIPTLTLRATDGLQQVNNSTPVVWRPQQPKGTHTHTDASSYKWNRILSIVLFIPRSGYARLSRHKAASATPTSLLTEYSASFVTTHHCVCSFINKEINTMSYQLFKAYWNEVSPRVAQQLAVTNGVSKAQVQLWTFTLRIKGE